ncbi:MAG: hypothetical protein O3A00_00140 [Planctomycetota bacterium]|nr:hypothetical protein [Planctomycetota bacterium]
MSLLMVMVTVSTSLILTMTFLRTQTVQVQMSENVSQQDYALQAAQSGAAVALKKMSSPEWQGVDVSLSGVFHQDFAGKSGYTVSFHPHAVNSSAKTSFHPSLYLTVRSQGSWQSKANSARTVYRTVEVLVHLQPRVTQRDGANYAVADAAPNPNDYDAIQQYALFASDTSNSLIFDPGDCIEGNLFVGENIRLFMDPPWKNKIRETLLESIGLELVNTDGSPRYPHPLAGPVTHVRSMSHQMAEDLKRLRVSSNQVDRTPTLPNRFEWTHWKTYRLYEGGPLYRAVQLSGYLRNKTYQPSEQNPLGVFYVEGNCTILDYVTIVGTLLSTGTISILGKDVSLTSFNWRDAEGKLLTPDAAEWPRLPAIAAEKLFIEREVRVVIEGAINLHNDFLGAGCSLAYAHAKDIDWEFKATASPSGQPHSWVQVLDDSIDLTWLQNSGDYEVWLDDGFSGNWHRITRVDSRGHRFRIVGEVNSPLGTRARVRPSRIHYVEFRGPLSGRKHEVHRLAEWDLSKNLWDKLHLYWEKFNKDYRELNQPENSFVAFLADPRTFQGLGDPHEKQGLPLEATFHLRRPVNVHYRWSPPLFGPLKPTTMTQLNQSTSDGTFKSLDKGGYRWSVVSWNEVPPTKPVALWAGT